MAAKRKSRAKKSVRAKATAGRKSRAGGTPARARSTRGERAGKVSSSRGVRRKALKPARSRTVTKKAPKIARDIVARDAAVDDLAKRVRPGKVSLGRTRKLTPTKAGFRALRRELAGARKVVTKRGAKPKAYTFQLSIRYRGPDGRFKKLDRVEGVFPLKRSLTARKKRGESVEAAFERVTEQRIKAAVFRAIDRAEGVAQYPEHVRRALASGDRERITRAMRAFKKRRGVSFQVEIERHVTPGEAGRHVAKKRRR